MLGLVTVLVGVLIAAITITVHTMRHRHELTTNYEAALNLAAHSSTLRTSANELFTWQVASALGVLERRPGALDGDEPAQVRYRAAVTTLVTTLDRLAAGPLDDAERDRLTAARDALQDLERIDAQVRTDYNSGDPARMADAGRLATTGGIDQYQIVSQSLTSLATLLEERAGQLGDESEALDLRVQLLVIALAAVMIVALVGVVLWVWNDERHSHEVISQLTIEANLDPLTNVANRRLWDHALVEELRRARLGGAPFTVVLIDLDHFKRFNDTFGHPAGDRHLRKIADLCLDAVRRNDLVARLGGEEFGLLLTGSVAADAARVVERLRPLVPDGQTFSAGVAEWNGSETVAELVARADRALYAAKSGGRDRLALASA